MKGLCNEDKDYDSDDQLNQYKEIKEIKTSTCPLTKRSLLKKKYNKSAYKTNNINIISNLNNSDLQLPNESPKKIQNTLKSYYSIIKQNKKNYQKKEQKNKALNLVNKNNINYIFMKTVEIPQIKEFNFYYEIPLTGKYDFIFLLRGGLSKNDWILKTKNIRKCPRYLKNTLFFQSQIKLQEIHKYNFSKIYRLYMMIKKKGIDLYTNKKYRECIELFNYAYGLFKWIEFKDKNFKINLINNETFAILDDAIEEKKVIMEHANDKEEEIYKSSILFILEIMAYCHIELRLYSNAIECLDECVSIARNNYPDVYLRRAQARIYNKKISDEELKMAEKDINKALNLVLLHNSNIQKKYNPDANINYSNQNIINTEIYYKTKNKFNQIIQKRLEIKINNIRKLIGQFPNCCNCNNNAIINNQLLHDKNNDNIPYINSQDIERQYKILKEIKKKYNLAVKFFTKTKNQDQLDLTYKEYESFNEVFYKFKYFYKFSINSLDKRVIEHLNDNEKRILFDSKNKKIIEKNKIRICEHIFIHGNYNVELYKYVVDKIFEEEKSKKTKDNKVKYNILHQILNSSFKGKNFIIKISLCFIILNLVTIGFHMCYLKHFRNTGIIEIDK